MSTEKEREKAIVGARIKEARTFLGLKQLDLAISLGFDSYAPVKDMERGATSLKKPIARLFELVHGISEEWLLSGNGQMVKPQDVPTIFKISNEKCDTDSFDEVLDSFFDKVKMWVAEENGRATNSAIEFTEEFNDAFGGYVEWRKKQTGRGVVPGPPSKVSNSGK